MRHRDQMLDELHAIRRKHDRETRHLSDEEYVRHLHKEVEEGLAREGYRIVSEPDGTMRLGRIESEDQAPLEPIELIEDAESGPMLDEIRRKIDEETQHMTSGILGEQPELCTQSFSVCLPPTRLNPV
ncbi:MAG: hypothetical protein HYU64_09015 [Armatimonadetes bacterium]|nr:hypothetical protein [Armatimonadota bacterium]